HRDLHSEYGGQRLLCIRDRLATVRPMSRAKLAPTESESGGHGVRLIVKFGYCLNKPSTEGYCYAKNQNT
ncbi:MAG: hypothetical protein OXI43_22135, partial [Candidatus Poribacteria bacterium]|nr:hypothetical protein [Candidatus Poribacteria bacterium]